MTEPTLPVYIIHWNAPEWCLSAVDSVLLSVGVEPYLTVVDNGSSPSAVCKLEASLPSQVRLLKSSQNLGFAGGANLCIDDACASGTEWLVLAAHDVIVKPDCLWNLLETAKASPKFGALGPIFWNAEWTLPTSLGGLWDSSRGARHRNPFPGWERQKVLEADWLPGALLLLRVDAVTALGGFSEPLFAYCEDVDLCLRLRDSGWTVGVVTRAHAREQGNAASTLEHVYYIARNSLILTRRRAGRWRMWRRAVRVAGYSLRAGVGSLLPWRSKERRASSRAFALGQARAVFDALRGCTGPRRGWHP